MAPAILRWPAPAVWLLAALLLDTRALAAPPPAAPSSLHQAAWPTVTLPHRVLSVVPLPRPTANSRGRAPRDLAAAASDASNTICGYIGGNVNLPATCAAGSHCVLDAEHSAIGCCPNGGAACTAGVYTGCIDGTATSTATVANPYVYTCTGNDVCYRNTFSGGYFQYGCVAAAAASTLVHEVVAAAAVESVRVSFTGVYAAAASSTTALSSSLFSPPPTTLSTTSSTSSSSALASASTPSSMASHQRVGVIAGATMGSVAGLLLFLGLLAFFLLHRRRKQRARARDDATHRFDEEFMYNPRDAYGSPVPLKTCASFSDFVDSPSSPMSPLSPLPRSPLSPLPRSPLSPLPRSPVSPVGPLPATDTKGSSVWTRQRSTSSPPSSRPPSSYVAVTAAVYRASIISNGSRHSRTSRHSQLLIDNDDNNNNNNNGWGRSAAHHLRTLSYPPPGSYRQLSPYGDYPTLSGSEGGFNGPTVVASPEPVSSFDDSDAGSAGSSTSTVRRRPAWV